MLTQSVSIAQDSPDALKAWLTFTSTLIWQGIVVLFVFLFREQLSDVLERISKFKISGLEAELQREAKDAIKLTGEASKVLDSVDLGGFFTSEGVKLFVAESGLLRQGERVRGSLLLFQTESQHTWLVATDRQLFCILDDRDTRKSGKLIQWRQTFADSKPIRVRRYKKTIGLVDLGEATDWLYSKRLHEDPETLKSEILELFPEDARRT